MNQNADTGSSGLVLSGGGAFGAYEVGIIHALYDGESPATAGLPLDAGVFAGTSVGNFNAAVMAMNEGGPEASIKRLYDLWINEIADNGDGRGNGVYRIRGDVDNYLDPRIPGSPIEQLKRLFGDVSTLGGFAARSTERFVSSQGQLLSRLTGLFDMSVFLNTDPFCELVKKSIDPQALRVSTKSLTVTATCWSTGEPWSFRFRDMSDERTWEAIRASAAIPGLFPAVCMDGQTFLDGGVVMNTPIKPAILGGATEIHVISLNPSVADLGSAYSGTTLDIMHRVLASMIAANISEDIESARWINEGLEVLDRAELGELDAKDCHQFVRVAGQLSKKCHADGTLPRKLTIHRYFPKKALGDMLGLLNFDRSAIDEMIAQGYSDACAHDCKVNNCLIPNQN